MNQPNAHASPVYSAPPYAAAPAPNSTSRAKPSFPVVSFIFAFLAVVVGIIGFLIAGFRGHSAGWELMAIPTLVTFALALFAFIGAIMALVRRSWIGGVLTIGAAGFGSLLALVGFVLGA
jgi:hypothetical protein